MNREDQRSANRADKAAASSEAVGPDESPSSGGSDPFEGCDCWSSLQAFEDASIENRPPEGGTPPTCAARPRFPSWRAAASAPERIGLALSGGGIRSATFNLGVLQELDELKLLSGVDYLSTVSGGGYIGGFWSAWLARRQERIARGKTEKSEGVRKGEREEENTSAAMFPRDEPEAEEVRHLREFSSFLRPRMSLLTASTGRILAGAFGTVLPSVLIALAVIVFVLALWTVVSQFLTGAAAERTGVPGLNKAGWMLVATAVTMLVGEGLWRRRPEAAASRAGLAYFWWSLVAVTCAGACWWGLWYFVPLPSWMLIRPLAPGSSLASVGLVALPALAWLATASLLLIPRILFSRLAAYHRRDPQPARTRRAALDRVLSWTLLGVAIWLVIGGAWLGGQWLAGVGAAGIAGAVTAALSGGGSFAVVRRLFSAQPNKPSGARWRALLRPWIPRLIATITILAAAAASAALLVLWAEAMAWAHLGWPLLVAFLLLVIVAGLFDPHENGFHALYRGRLARSYLGASNRTAPAFAAEVAPGDDLGVDTLPQRPLHLICCTANDLAGDELPSLHRGAQSAVVSRLGLQVGDRWRRWDEAAGKAGRAPSLADVMTASGAAFNSLMGSISMRIGRPSTFLLAALGLRLGLWLEGPKTHLSASQRGLVRLQRWLPGLLFLRELLGLSTARSGWVHLSDGAHFENLALYELIRRHCRYILLSDCGADPDVAFDDLGNAVRRVREDFGVEIDIDVEPLWPAEGKARQPMVAGTIRYPQGDQGILLYIKPTLVGGEPRDVGQYAVRNEAFPHETTLDQFYDEAQWEAYRRLGRHIAGKALANLLPEDEPSRDRRRLIRIFLEARLAWPPARDGDAPVLSEIEREWGAMEAELLEKGPVELCRHVLGSVPAAMSPSTASDKGLFEALPIVQRALGLMHSLVRSGLNDSSLAASHPLYKGWLNRLGRWATSRLFRAWWPWLAPTYPRPFKLFMEKEFALPIHYKAQAARLQRVSDPDSPGYTLERWRSQRREWSPKDGHLLGLILPLGPESSEILVGVIELSPGPEDGRLWVDSDRLFVPAGLWGIGIGELFVEKLEGDFRNGHLEKQFGAGRIYQVRVRALRINAVDNALWVGGGFKRQALSKPYERGGKKAKAEFVLDLDRVEGSSSMGEKEQADEGRASRETGGGFHTERVPGRTFDLPMYLE